MSQLPHRVPPGSSATAPSRARALGLALALAWTAALPSPAARAARAQQAHEPETRTQRLVLSSEFRVDVVSGRDLVLEVAARPGDDFASIADRVCGGASRGPELAAANPGIGPAAFERGPWVRVPLRLTSPEYRALVLRNLFPDDRRDDDGAWIHLARSGRLPTFDEGLWQVAEWFTGDGGRFEALRAANGLGSPELRNGQAVRIPAELLHAAFAPREHSADEALVYDRDAEGPYAGYRLRAGEALYSAVVLRFTGRTKAEDVGAVAELLRRRSGIRNLHDIPVGYLVKIPFDVLEPEFLPAGHPQRLEAERARAEMEQALAERPVGEARGLAGVVVVIDPGHGGHDLGTQHNGVWEHDYVYDIACRLKQRLERETRATVRLTLEDSETGCVPSKGDGLVANRKGSVQTHPPFLAKQGDSRVSANLRWYLSNSIYRKALRDGVDDDRVVFLSLHADARHPNLRGLMAYVPGSAYRTKTYGHGGDPYQRYAEVREQTFVSFPKKARVRSEALSKKLAETMVESFRRSGLPVQEIQPVRNRIIRGKSRFVPAVIRYNQVPTSVLVEVLNLRNSEDAALLATAVSRQRIADGLLDGLFRHFGEEPPAP